MTSRHFKVITSPEEVNAPHRNSTPYGRGQGEHQQRIAAKKQLTDEETPAMRLGPKKMISRNEIRLHLTTHVDFAVASTAEDGITVQSLEQFAKSVEYWTTVPFVAKKKFHMEMWRCLQIALRTISNQF